MSNEAIFTEAYQSPDLGQCGTLLKSGHKNSQSDKTLSYQMGPVRVISGFIFLLVLFIQSAFGSTLQEDIDQYYENLREEFNRIATESAVKKSRLATVDRYFVNVLKKKQLIHTIIRTNSKGVIINEVVRGHRPRRSFRNIAGQTWFRTVSRAHDPYYGYVKAKNGRYYLFWSRPILISTRSGGERFIGAIAVKIDLWDSFHKFTQKIEKRFLIRMGKKSLYSHKWQHQESFEEEEIHVPGLSNMVVRYESENITMKLTPEKASEAYEKDTVAIDGPLFGVANQIPEQRTTSVPVENESDTILKMVYIGLLILIGLLLLIVIFRIFLWFKNRTITRKIDKDDLF